MLPPPDKTELELEVDGHFRHNDKKDVARLLQKDATTLYRQLSPNQAHNNHVIYFFIVVLWAFDCIRQELGDGILAIVIRERAKWLCKGPEIVEHPATLTKNVGLEYVDAVDSEMRDKSVDEQIREWGDVIRSATRKQQALISLRAESFNGHARSFAKTVVAGRKEKAA